jgi:peptidoglycan/xylan/chitin deacetylase (PgdA/CDA1 family)
MLVKRRRLLSLGGQGLAAIVLGVAGRGRASERFRWPEGRRGAVSLTYDDGFASQLDYAMPQLEALGLRGTFFVTANEIPSRDADWRAAAARGHEIENHTIDHPCDLRRFTTKDYLKREIAPMEDYLDIIAGESRPRLYAYPCDATNLGPGSANSQARRYARMLKAAGIVAARTSEGEPNDPARFHAGAYRLHALAVGYDAIDPAAVAAYIQLAATRGHWAILVFHRLVQGIERQGDTTIADHREILTGIRNSDVWCAPLGRVAQHILTVYP